MSDPLKTPGKPSRSNDRQKTAAPKDPMQRDVPFELLTALVGTLSWTAMITLHIYFLLHGFGKVPLIGPWLDSVFPYPGSTRTKILAVAAIFRILRILMMNLVLSSHGATMGNSLVFPWVVGTIAYSWFIFLGLRCETTADNEPFDLQDIIAVVLLLLGSLIHSGSEIQRYLFKKHGGKGKLYAGGFFKFARNINDTGELVMFHGWSLLARGASWGGYVTAIVMPALMFLQFAKFTIPTLETYLKGKYGQLKWDRYVKKVPYRLIPYVY